MHGKKKNKSECKFMGQRNNRLNYKCKECGKRCSGLIDEAIKNFLTMYQFCKGDLNKFVLLLRKGIYHYEYIDISKKFNETSIPPKEVFYIELNLEVITNEDYADYGNIRNKKSRWVSWLVCSVWYIIAFKWIWKV